MCTAKTCSANKCNRLEKNIKASVSICNLTLTVGFGKQMCLKTEPRQFTNGGVMVLKLSTFMVKHLCYCVSLL